MQCSKMSKIQNIIILLSYITHCLAGLIIPGISLELKHSINKNPYYKDIFHINKESNAKVVFPFNSNSEFLVLNSKLLKNWKVLASVGFKENITKNSMTNHINSTTFKLANIRFPKIDTFTNDHTSIYIPEEVNILFVFNSLESPNINLNELDNISTLIQYAPPFKIPKFVRLSDFYLLLNKNYLAENARGDFEELYSKIMSPITSASNSLTTSSKAQKLFNDKNTKLAQINDLAVISNVTKPLFVIQFDCFDDESTLQATFKKNYGRSHFVDTTLSSFYDSFNSNKKMTYFDALAKNFIHKLGVKTLSNAEFCTLNIKSDQEYCLSINSSNIQYSQVPENQIYKRDLDIESSPFMIDNESRISSESLSPTKVLSDDEDDSDDESSSNYKPKFNPALFSGNYLDSFANLDKQEYADISFVAEDPKYDSLNNNEISVMGGVVEAKEHDNDEGDGEEEDDDEDNEIDDSHIIAIKNGESSSSKAEASSEQFNGFADGEEYDIVKRDLASNKIEIDLSKLLQNLHSAKEKIAKSFGISTAADPNIDIGNVREVLINQYEELYDRLVSGLLSQKTFGIGFGINNSNNESYKSTNSIQFSFSEVSDNQKRSFENAKMCLDISWNNVFSASAIAGSEIICEEQNTG